MKSIFKIIGLTKHDFLQFIKILFLFSLVSFCSLFSCLLSLYFQICVNFILFRGDGFPTLHGFPPPRGWWWKARNALRLKFCSNNPVKSSNDILSKYMINWRASRRCEVLLAYYEFPLDIPHFTSQKSFITSNSLRISLYISIILDSRIEILAPKPHSQVPWRHNSHLFHRNCV